MVFKLDVLDGGGVGGGGVGGGGVGGGGVGGGAEVMLMLTVFAAVAPLTAFEATLLFPDSTWPLLSTRTMKYQVPAGSALIVVVREVVSFTSVLVENEVLLVL
jgi:hypothetical protein